MEERINYCFQHERDQIVSHIADGRYDLVAQDGVIYFPANWEKTIRPGDSITMRLWPAKGKTSVDPDGDLVAKYGNKDLDTSPSANPTKQVEILDSTPEEEERLVFKGIGRTFTFSFRGANTLRVRILLLLLKFTSTVLTALGG